MSFQYANWNTFYGCSFVFKVVNFLCYLKTKEHSLATVLTVLTFKLQFSYCTFVYMCHSRILNNNIKKLHDICLRLSYNDKHSTFHELLKKKGCFVSIHTQNLRFLVPEMYKSAEGATIMEESFTFWDNKRFNLRSQNRNSGYGGTEPIFIWAQNLRIVPNKLYYIIGQF